MKIVTSLIFALLLIGCNGDGDSKLNEKLSLTLPQKIETIVSVGTEIKAQTTGEIATYAWSEGETLLSRKRVLNSEKFEGGEHNITLTVTDTKGATQTKSMQMLVYFMLNEFDNEGIATKLNRLTDIIYMNDKKRYHYLYDQQGRLVQQKSDILIKTFTYEGESRRILSIDGNYSDNRVDRAVYTYDSEGNRRSYRHIREGEETVNNTIIYRYDENENLLSIATIKEGEEDFILTYTYDERGNRLSEKSNSTKVYTYDNRDNKLTESYDADSDGVFETIDRFTYNAQNKVLKRVHYREGEEDIVFTYTYNKDGKILSDTVSQDGETKNTLIYLYSDNEKTVHSHYDFDGDGVTNMVVENRYDERGNLLSHRTDGDDMDNNDGHYDTSEFYTYDEHDNRLTYQRENIGGVWDRNQTYINSYDEQDTLVKLEVDGVVQFEKVLSD